MIHEKNVIVMIFPSFFRTSDKICGNQLIGRQVRLYRRKDSQADETTDNYGKGTALQVC